MERLGYSPEKFLAAAQQAQSVWDMSDVGEVTENDSASVLAYARTLETHEPAKEEIAMSEDEDQACFPVFDDDKDAERQQIKEILLEKVEEARRLGASAEFVEELL
ncbi:hypothetical protein DVH05_012677 [Phytophthora capsici]|nr:hypothetical protein DVH05_012677 [Phytophthora capsici]